MTYADTMNTGPTYYQFEQDHHQQREQYRHQLDHLYGRPTTVTFRYLGEPDARIDEGKRAQKLVYKRTQSRSFRYGWYKLNCTTVIDSKQGIVDGISTTGDDCTDSFMQMSPSQLSVA
ncbi:hypothetical protein M9194_00500 [Vibrio sp. S4M6]|uniref:hypothetical protein n=1 Tax=Vibrio sinus TaxID=2946865 RepID=UPI00202A13A8|nr:hypothetical protein [Vibrio sinus]MCL9779910.1 hypothetical protein [Vibrio sinus]